MKTIILSILSLTILSGCFAQKNGKSIIVEKQFQHIAGVNVSSVFKVNVTKGSSSSVKISIPENYKNRLVVKVDEDGILCISIDAESFSNANWTAEVVCPNLKQVKASSVSSVNILSSFDANELYLSASSASNISCKEPFLLSAGCDIQASGASNIDCNIQANSIDAHASSASNIYVKGSADTLNVKVAGASSVDCKGLHSNVAEFYASGASTINTGNVKTISLEATGASDITYDGKATVMKSNSNGGSSLNKR